MGQQSEDAESSRRRIIGGVKGEKEWRENRQRQEVESKTTREDIFYKIKQETNNQNCDKYDMYESNK